MLIKIRITILLTKIMNFVFLSDTVMASCFSFSFFSKTIFFSFFSDSYCSWSSLMAPKGTPVEVVARLNQELNRALKTPEVLSRLSSMEVEPEGGEPQRVTQLRSAELARWTRVIQSANLKAE